MDEKTKLFYYFFSSMDMESKVEEGAILLARLFLFQQSKNQPLKREIIKTFGSSSFNTNTHNSMILIILINHSINQSFIQSMLPFVHSITPFTLLLMHV